MTIATDAIVEAADILAIKATAAAAAPAIAAEAATRAIADSVIATAAAAAQTTANAAAPALAIETAARSAADIAIATAATMALRSKQSLTQLGVIESGGAFSDVTHNDTTNNSLNSRMFCRAPANANITDIVLGFPGFCLNLAGEGNFPNAYTVTASIEYPLGSTPIQVFFAGASSATVNPGRVLVKSDPIPIPIPAGAQFAAKCFVTWTGGFYLASNGRACTLANNSGEWTTNAIGAADHTLDNTVLANTTAQVGFGPLVYATTAAPQIVVGLVGDSIGGCAADQPDPITGTKIYSRAMRGVIPVINMSIGGDSYAAYFLRHEGRDLALRNSITHCLMQLGTNDIFGGAVSLATMQVNLQKAIAPYLARGVKCHAVTFMPRTTSTDFWRTTANQTTTSVPAEAVRQAYNSWLINNWPSLGLSGIFDMGHAVDPTDSGKWISDTLSYVPNIQIQARGYATLASGVIASVANLVLVGLNSAGTGAYPLSTTIPCMVAPYPGDTGSGAVVTAATNGVGQTGSWTVVNGGGGYNGAPIIEPLGNFTADGTHPSARACSEIILRTAMSPASFTLN